jgi:hypothetical protein
VRYAPITDPAVATAAYSYHGLRWLAARIAVKMSGPKCRQRRAIDDGEREKPQRSQVAKYRGKTVAPTRCGMLEEDVQHEPTISTLLGSFWGAAVPPVAAMPCDSQSDCEPKKVPSNEPQERLLAQSSREGRRSQQDGADY